MVISVTDYLDVVSSWCFWSEASWAELKKRYGGRVEFQWKIALMDPSGLPTSREQEQWFYRRSGMMMHSAFMLNTDWYDQVCRSGSRRIAWRKRQRILVSLMIVSGSRSLAPRCAKAKTLLTGILRLKSRQKLPASKPANCLSARNRRRLRSAFEHRRPNSARYRLRNDPRS